MTTGQVAEVVADGHLALSDETCQKLRLTVGTRFELLTDNEDVLVLRRVADGMSSVTAAELRLQQAALAKVWDDPDEDRYNASV